MLLYNAAKPTGLGSFQEFGESDFLDVAGSQIDTFMYEDLSTSRGSNIDKERWDEIRKVKDLAPELFGPESIPQTNPNAPEVLQQAWNETAMGQDASRLSDWEGYVEPNLEELKKRFPDANIRNRDEIDSDISSQAQFLRDEFERNYQAADGWDGFMGTLAGGAVASMADPINIMTMPLGVGKVAGAGFFKAVGVVAARSFGIGAATEASIQPFVYNYKKDIESPYELSDAIFNITAGGIGNSLLSGAGHAITKGFDVLRGKVDLPDTYENRRLSGYIETIQEMQRFTDESNAKTVAELDSHLKALNTAMEDVKAGKKVDFEALGKAVDEEIVEGFSVTIDNAASDIELTAKRIEEQGEVDQKVLREQVKLEAIASQRLDRNEKRAAQNAPEPDEVMLNSQSDLGRVQEAQKATWDGSQAEAKLKSQSAAKQAQKDLKQSRKQGDMILKKAKIEELKVQLDAYKEQYKQANVSRDQYITAKSEETSKRLGEAVSAKVESAKYVTTVTGLKSELKQIDESFNSETVDAEAIRLMNDDKMDGVAFDENGNTVNLRDSLIEDENEIMGIESVKVCML